MDHSLLISTGILNRQSLGGKIVVVTGAGGGIGYEACRALIWLGARVVIAEINSKTGKDAAFRLNQEFGAGSTLFVQTDVSDEGSIRRLAQKSKRYYGKVDIVLNNATLAPLGAVKDLPIKEWDISYKVNLRGPVLLARAFLPGMIERKSGAFISVSSTGLGYMAAYESLKAAQVQLANTLDVELEGTGVWVFTIGPGFVPTQTASSAIPCLAKLMGKSTEEVLASIKGATITVEAAGAGFAAAVALAEKYHGLEISSMAALIDAGIDQAPAAPQEKIISADCLAQIGELAGQIRTTLAEQSADWKRRSIFEQQWLVRSFKQSAGRPVEGWLEQLETLEKIAKAGDSAGVLSLRAHPVELGRYYSQLADSARGYIKDPVQREEQLRIVYGWQAECQALDDLLK